MIFWSLWVQKVFRVPLQIFYPQPDVCFQSSYKIQKQGWLSHFQLLHHLLRCHCFAYLNTGYHIQLLLPATNSCVQLSGAVVLRFNDQAGHRRPRLIDKPGRRSEPVPVILLVDVKIVHSLNTSALWPHQDSCLVLALLQSQTQVSTSPAGPLGLWPDQLRPRGKNVVDIEPRRAVRNMNSCWQRNNFREPADPDLLPNAALWLVRSVYSCLKKRLQNGLKK